MRSKTKTKTVVSKLEMPDGNLSLNDKANSNTLNDYFSLVFVIEPDQPLPDFEDWPFNQLLEHIVITDNDVEKALPGLKSGKSQGPDSLHPKYLKELKDLIKEPKKISMMKRIGGL